MRWTPGGRSNDIDDLRDSGGAPRPLGIGGGRVSLVGMLILGALSLVFKTDLITPFLGGAAPAASACRADPALTRAEEPGVQFVWGHSTAQRNILEEGDPEEALNAAAAIGDDRLQRMSTGRVAPESFTHGSSAQRVGWFKRGLSQGRIAACDTFSDDL